MDTCNSAEAWNEGAMVSHGMHVMVKQVRYDVLRKEADVWMARRNYSDIARRSSCLGAQALAIHMARREWSAGGVDSAVVYEQDGSGRWRVSVAFGVQIQQLVV